MVPFTNDAVGNNAVPDVETSYHLIAVPVADKLATVAPLQNGWVAVAVGAAVVLITAVTSVRKTLSQPFRVWEA